MEKKQSLFDITQKVAAIEDLLDQADEDGVEYSEGQQARILEVLSDVELDRDEKIDGYCWLIARLDGESKSIKEEEQRLYARRKSREKKVAYLKECMQEHMHVLREKKLTTANHTVALQKAGGKLSMKIDEGFIPEEFKEAVTTYVVKQDEVRAKLEAGESVLGAMLLERKEILRIR